MIADGCDNTQLTDPALREMFSREHLLASDWYRERLLLKQKRDISLWQRHLEYLDRFLAKHPTNASSGGLDLSSRRKLAAAELSRVCSPSYVRALVGCLGSDRLRSPAGHLPAKSESRPMAAVV